MAEEGTQFFNVNLQHGNLNYETDEFQNSGEGLFYCRNCGNELDISSDEVIEILELKKK